MDEFEQQIKRALSAEDGFDDRRSETVEREAIRMYDSKLKNYKYLTWGFLALSAIEMMILAVAYAFASSPKVLIGLAVVFLVSYNSTILMKLWYWQMNVKFSTLKELKEMQLQMAELARALKGSEKQADEA